MPKSNSETKKVLKDLDFYFKVPNPGLRSYFGLVRAGQPEVYRTTFGKGRSPQTILKQWVQQLGKLSKEWPTLLDFENDLASKVGPMSVMLPLKDRMKDIDHYYEDILLPQTPISTTGIESVLREWQPAAGLRIRGQNQTVANMKLSTNSGNPYFGKRRRYVNDTIPCMLTEQNRELWQLLPGSHQFKCCAVLGWRGQEGGHTKEDVKQRVVWMFPFAVNVEELRFYQPAIEVAQDFGLVPAWVSMELVDARITQLFDTKGRDDLVVCTDFSKFDQHFNPVMQDAAKQIISGLITHDSSGEYWMKNVFPVKYYIPLMYDYGYLRVGQHGMGSGSGGTNFDETVVHRALQWEAASSNSSTLNPNSQCLGDDGILSYPGITVEDVVRSYTRHGLEMNRDKQYASKHDCIYLRRWHHTKYRKDGICVGVYSTARALGRLMYQERYYDPDVWSKEMVALRQLSIIENCKWHPMREEFVAFCMKRDKYRLGLDIPGFFDNIQGIAKEATELMPDFLGYTKSLQEGKTVGNGIEDWWIVKYLKSM
nr:MAG: putative RNA-dependent RNA polymerase [Sichuan picobirnavirus 64]